MESILGLIQASPADTEQAMIGILTGALVITALAMSPVSRRLISIGSACFIAFIVLTRGLDGLSDVAQAIVADARAHEWLVKGLVVGKVFSGFLWSLKVKAL